MKRWKASCAAVCAAVLAANAWRLAKPAVPAWDDAWYLELSFRLFHALARRPLSAFGLFAHAFKIKAPLIILAPLPFYAVFGARESVAPWANQILLALTWLAVWRIGRALRSERAGWAAAAACALLPLHYGLSRLFLVETLLTTLVCWAVALALEARPGDGREATRGAVLGLGLLSKSLFPLHLLGPIWLRREALRPGWRKTLAVAAAVAASWYAFNLIYVVGFALNAAFGGIARDYSATAAGFARAVLHDGISWPYVASLAALLALARPRIPALLWAWLLPPLLAVAASSNKDVRFLSPALPVLAIAAGLAADKLAARAAPLLLSLLLPPLVVLYAQSVAPVWPIGAFVYNGAIPEPGWDRGALLDAVARRAGDGSVVAVGLEDRFLNANNLASLSASRGESTSFISLGYRQASAEGALIRLKDKGARYLVLFDGVPEAGFPIFLNRADAGIRAMIESGRLRAEFLETVVVAPGVTARLYGIAP